MLSCTSVSWPTSTGKKPLGHRRPDVRQRDARARVSQGRDDVVSDRTGAWKATSAIWFSGVTDILTWLKRSRAREQHPDLIIAVIAGFSPLVLWRLYCVLWSRYLKCLWCDAHGFRPGPSSGTFAGGILRSRAAAAIAKHENEVHHRNGCFSACAGWMFIIDLDTAGDGQPRPKEASGFRCTIFRPVAQRRRWSRRTRRRFKPIWLRRETARRFFPTPLPKTKDLRQGPSKRDRLRPRNNLKRQFALLTRSTDLSFFTVARMSGGPAGLLIARWGVVAFSRERQPPFDNFRTVRQCRLIWRDGDFLGWRSKADHDDKARTRHLCRARSDVVECGAGT